MKNITSHLLEKFGPLTERIRVRLLESAFDSIDRRQRKKAFALLGSLQERDQPRAVAAALGSRHPFTRMRARRWRLRHRALERKYGVGKRVFRMSPLHHHFQMKGYHEAKIVMRFLIIGIFLAVMTVVTLKLR